MGIDELTDLCIAVAASVSLLMLLPLALRVLLSFHVLARRRLFVSLVSYLYPVYVSYGVVQDTYHMINKKRES